MVSGEEPKRDQAWLFTNHRSPLTTHLDHRRHEVCSIMKKWYAPSLLWLAICTGSLAGCAQTSQWVTHWSHKDTKDTATAQVDGKAKTDAKAKPRDDAKIADSSKSKSKSSKEDKSVASADKPSTPKQTDPKSTDKPSSAKSASVAANAKKPETKKPEPKTADTAIASTDTAKAPNKPLTSKNGVQDPFAMTDFQVPEPRGKVNLPDADFEKPEFTKSEIKATATMPPQVQTVSHTKSLDDLPEWARDKTIAPPVAPTTAPVQQATATQIRRADASTLAGGAKSSSMTSLCPDAQGEVRELVTQLDSPDVETVKRTIHRLGRMQTHGTASAPALRKLLNHRDPFVRVHAALALIRMQQPSPQVTETLIVGLRSSDPAVRSFAAAVIAELGPSSTDMLPALSAALQDHDGYVRLHVAEVLIRHEQWSQQALHALIDCLRDRDENVRWLSTYSLAELAPQSSEAVAALAQAVGDPSPKVQIGAAYALGEIGPLAHPAHVALEKACRSEDPELRTAAESALQRVQ